MVACLFLPQIFLILRLVLNNKGNASWRKGKKKTGNGLIEENNVQKSSLEQWK